MEAMRQGWTDERLDDGFDRVDADLRASSIQSRSSISGSHISMKDLGVYRAHNPSSNHLTATVSAFERGQRGIYNQGIAEAAG